MDNQELQQLHEEAFQRILDECFSDDSDLVPDDDAIINAMPFDALSKVFRNANEALYEVSVESLAENFEECLNHIKQGLSDFSNHTKTLREDPKEIQSIADHARHAENLRDQELLNQENIHGSEISKRDQEISPEHIHKVIALVEEAAKETQLALASITKNELEILAQLSLAVAHSVLPLGESLFSSFHNEQRMMKRKRCSDRITIEELTDDDDEKEKEREISSPNPKHMKLKEYLRVAYGKMLHQVSQRPYMAGIVATIGLPFIGLLVPLAGLLAAGLLLEKYAPQYTTLIWEIGSNTIQAIKLWIVLLKIGMKHCGRVVLHGFQIFYSKATENGLLVATSEVLGTAYGIGCIACSWIIQASSSVFLN